MGRKWLGQGSIEFAIIIGVLLVIIIMFIVVIQKQSAKSSTERIQVQVKDFANIISNEIVNAKASPGSYSREFFIPEQIQGMNYSIALDNGSEITVTIQDNDYVIFLDNNVVGDIKKGNHLIEKKSVDANITITPIS